MTFNSIEDVEDEIERCKLEALEEGFNIGEAVYMQLPFFANDAMVVERKCQDFISLYNFCHSTRTPVTQSALQTPVDIFDAMNVIAEEISKIKMYEEEKGSNK